MHYAWSAPVLPTLCAKDSPIKITKIDVIWLEGVYLLSGLMCLPLITYLVDKIGRQKAILVASVANLLSWILIGGASSLGLLYCGRIIAGAFGDMAYVAIPMYLSEISSEKFRGLLTCLNYNMILLGTLLISSTAPFMPYYGPALIAITLISIQLATFPFKPASPYFLLTVNRRDEAKAALQKLRADQTNIDEEFNQIVKAVEKQNSHRGKCLDLVLVKSNRKAVIIVTVLIFCQFFSGYSAVVMNLHTILTEAESKNTNVDILGIVFYLLMVISATFCCVTVDKFGKKSLLIVSALFTAICLLVISVCFSLLNSGYNAENLASIPTVAIMLYAVTFKLGLGFLPQVLVSELFPNNVKALGMSYGDFLYGIFSFLSLIFYQYLSHFYGHQVPLYVFSAVSFLGAVFTKYYVPETKGKTLDAIQVMLQEN